MQQATHVMITLPDGRKMYMLKSQYEAQQQQQVPVLWRDLTP
jgi:hypothetical protein